MAANPYLSKELIELAKSAGLADSLGLGTQSQPQGRPGYKTIFTPKGPREIPANPTPQQKYELSLELAQEFPDQYGSLLDPYQTLAGGTAEFFKAIPRGAAGSLLGAAQGAVGLFTPGVDTDTEKSLREAQQYLETESPLAPEDVYRDEFATQLGAGLGSVATYALPGGIAKAAGAAATSLGARAAGLGLATTGGAGEQAQRVQAEREAGTDISTGAEMASLLAGFGIGASEMLPVERLFSKVKPETGSALLNIFSRIDKRNPVAGSIAEDIAKLTSGALKQGAVEGLQEGLSGMAQNLVSKTIYDPDMVIGESFLDDIMVGGGVGAIADVLVDAMGGRRTVANKIYRDKEEKLRRDRIERINLADAEALRNQRIDEMMKRGNPPEGVLMLPSPATVTGGPAAAPGAALPNDGVYTVSLAGNPDRFTQATVFTSPDRAGVSRTMVYSPESDGYFDITDQLANGRSIDDAVAVAIAGDLGVSKPSKAADERAAFGAIRKSVSVRRDASIPPVNPAAIQASIERGEVYSPDEDSFIKVQALPNGTFGLVDVTRGVAVSAQPFKDQNSAFSELRKINDQNAAISAANIINYLGFNGNNPAYYLASSVRSPQSRMVQRSVVSAFLPKESRKDLKPFYSPEEAKKLLGPKAFDEMMQQFGQVNEANNLLAKYVKNPLEVDPNKRSITAAALKKLGDDKNLKIDVNDKAFKDYAKYWTGTENWGDMSNGQRMYLMTRIANTQKLPEQIKFPNLMPRQYKRSQFEAVLAKMGEPAAEGKANALSLADIQKVTGLAEDPARQIFQDMVASGRAKPVVPGKIQLIKSEAEYQADRKAKAQGFPLEETPAQAAARMRSMGYSEESIAAAEKAGQQDKNPPKASPQVEAEIDAETDIAVAEGADPVKERTAATFDRILADALKRYGVARFVKQRIDAGSLKARKTPSGQIVVTQGQFDPVKRQITINVGDLINDPNISDDEIIRRIVQIVDHEVIHAMREADLFTEAEWNTLTNFVRTAKIDKKFLDGQKDTSLIATGKAGVRVTTMLDDVRIRYAGKNLNEMQLIEEAVAESFRLWRQYGGKFAAGKPASLFQRMLNFIQSFAKAWRGSGATSPESIFSAIASGEIGNRELGLSIFNQGKDAPIRTLNLADQEVAKTKKILKKGDTARGPVKIKQADIEVGIDEELAGYSIDNRGVAGLTKERINSLLNEYGYANPMSKAKAYLTYITPDQFINATSPESYRETIKEESRPLNVKELAEQQQPIFLKMKRTPFNPDGTPEVSKPNAKTLVGSVVWEISGHEGRHRMQALKDAGVNKVPVVIQLSEDGGDFRSKPDNAIDITSNTVFVRGQDFSSTAVTQSGRRVPYSTERGDDFLISNTMTPISYSNAKTLEQRFVNPELDVSFMEMPISEADAKRLEGFLETSVGTAPFGYTPRFNASAPKQALIAAMDYEQSGKEASFPDEGRKFMLSEIASEPIGNDIIEDNVQRYGRIKSENYTAGQKAIMLIESLGNGGLKSAFDDFSRVFRKAVVDRYNEFRRQEGLFVGTENERYLLAETKASAALAELDRVRGWLSSVMNYGGIKWVTGNEMVTNNPKAFEDDPMAGYVGIDESVKGLLPIMEPLVNGSVPNGLGQFKTYSTLKRVQGFRSRAKDAKDRLDNLPPDADPELIKELKETIAAADKVRLVDNPSDVRISKLIAEVDAQYPEVTEAYNEYQKWNNTLITFGQKTGILTRDLADKWREWGDYFPFYEEMEEAVMKDHGFRTKSSMTKADFLTKALTESAKNLEDADPLEMITKNAFGILQAGLKNVAAGRILRNSVLVDEARRLTSADPAKEAAKLRERGSYVKTVFENGNVVYYEVADPLLHESMMNYGDPTLNTATKILAMPANALRELVTRDPGFILANMFRDTLSSFVTSGAGYTPVIDTFKQFAIGDIQTLVKTAIVGGYDFSSDPKDLLAYIKSQYRKMGVNIKDHSVSQPNAVMRLWDFMGDMTTRSDASTRMAVYNAILKETGSEAAAREAAIEVINFSRRGSNPLWRVVTAAVPFLNARIQGLDVIYRTAAGKYSPYDGLEDRSVNMKRALMRGASLAALTGMYFMLMQDNEEYKKARREVRDDNWLIPAPIMGDKVMLKLPIPFEIGMLFKAFPEIFLNSMFGDMDARGLRESLVRQATNTASFNITGFQMFKPLVDVIRNKNSFTGKDIVPYWVNERTEQSQQFDERTSLISKKIGEELNLSPMKLDYIVGGYGGSLGLSLFLLADKIVREASGDKTAGTRADYTDINNVPLLRRFIYNAGKAGTLQEQEFYELRDESDKAYQTIRSIAKEGDVAKYYAYLNSRRALLNTRQEVLAVERYLKRYRDTREAILKSDLSAEQKRQLLDEISADKDLRLTGVPILRERAEIPARAASAIFDVFIG